MPRTLQSADQIAQAVQVLRDAGFVFAGPVRYLTVRDAAAALSVSGTTIRKWISEGRLPRTSMLPGGDLRVDAGDVEALAAAGRLAGPSRRLSSLQPQQEVAA